MNNRDFGVLTILENTPKWPITPLNVKTDTITTIDKSSSPPQLSYVQMIISLKIVKYCRTLLSIYMKNIKTICGRCCNCKIYYMKLMQ